MFRSEDITTDLFINKIFDDDLTIVKKALIVSEILSKCLVLIIRKNIFTHCNFLGTYNSSTICLPYSECTLFSWVHNYTQDASNKNPRKISTSDGLKDVVAS